VAARTVSLLHAGRCRGTKAARRTRRSRCVVRVGQPCAADVVGSVGDSVDLSRSPIG
jgi:hypothetical protein